MGNTITVYWGCYEDEWVRAKQPEHIIKNITSNEHVKNIELNRCPGFHNYMKNIYGLKSLYDYSFYIDNEEIKTNDYNQKFFDRHLLMRSLPAKCFSLLQRYVFITDEKSLEMSVGITPFFENNEIANRCSVIPGTLDIGKWFRTLDFAFFLKQEFDSLSIKENDIFQYIQFHTDKKIIFKHFFINDYIERQILSVDNARLNRGKRFRSLESYYDLFKGKKYLINEIKNNVV